MEKELKSLKVQAGADTETLAAVNSMEKSIGDVEAKAGAGLDDCNRILLPEAEGDSTV